MCGKKNAIATAEQSGRVHTNEKWKTTFFIYNFIMVFRWNHEYLVYIYIMYYCATANAESEKSKINGLL